MLRVIAISCLLAAGCATSQTTEMVEVKTPPSQPRPAEQLEVHNENLTVRAEYQGGDIFEFIVKNLRPEPVMVDRDAVELVLPTGQRMRRLPGGAGSLYTLQPAGFHRVNVRFDVSSLHVGDVVQIDFSPALQLVGGRTVTMPPLAVTYR